MAKFCSILSIFSCIIYLIYIIFFISFPIYINTVESEKVHFKKLKYERKTIFKQSNNSEIIIKDICNKEPIFDVKYEQFFINFNYLFY